MARFAVGDVLGRSFRLVFDNFGAFLATQGVFILLAALVALGQSLVVGPTAAGLAAEGGSEAAMAEAMRASGVMLGGGLLSTALLMLGAFFGVGAAREALEGRTASLGSVWERFGHRLGAFVGATLIAVLIVFAALIALAVLTMVAVTATALGAGFTGGLADAAGAAGAALLLMLAFPVIVVWLLLRWYLVAPVAAFEDDATATGALSRSADLTKGNRGAILLLVIALVLIMGAASAALALLPFGGGLSVAAGGEAAAPSPAEAVLGQALNAALQLALIPVGTAAAVLVYDAVRGADAPAPAGGELGDDDVPWDDLPEFEG